MQRSVQNRVIVSLLIINLIGSILVPSLATAIGSEARVLLCTTQGFQWVTLEVEQEFKLVDDANLNEHCLYCLSSNDEFESLVFAYAFLVIEPAEYLFLKSVDLAGHKNYLLEVHQSRAPPLFT